jgi:hypothetical protein
MRYPYSETYREARGRFRAAARDAGARLEAHTVRAAPDEEESLTIDVARIGPASPRWSVVVSSGVHGVEGFFGSAIQTAFLQQSSAAQFAQFDGEFIFIHAINPFGFSELRRVNEDNVDLNRNFLLAGDAYTGASAEYIALSDLLDGSVPTRLFDPFLARIGWTVARHGLSALKQAVAGGQYQCPKGLFFGGHRAARSTEILEENILKWIGSRRAVHLDLHSGLGGYAKSTLLAPPHSDNRRLDEYRQLFGSEAEITGVDRGLAFKMRGDLGQYLAAVTSHLNYTLLFVEFGTYSPLRVLNALRKENQAHFCTPQGSAAQRVTKAALLECFSPASPSWRTPVLQQGLQLIWRAQHLVSH